MIPAWKHVLSIALAALISIEAMAFFALHRRRALEVEVRRTAERSLAAIRNETQAIGQSGARPALADEGD